MLKKLLRDHFIKFLLVLVCFGGQVRAAEMVDWIVAVINNDVILNSDVQEELAILEERFRQNNQQPPPRDLLKREVVALLIEISLQRQRSQQLGIVISQAEVIKTMESILSNSGLTGDEYAARQGMTEGQLFQRIADEVAITRAMKRDNNISSTLSESRVNEVLRGRLASEMAREYLVEHVEIAPADAATARELQQLVGDRFTARAAEISISDREVNSGWRLPTEMPKDFFDAIKNLSPGTNSAVIEFENSLHVLRLVAKRPLVPGQSRAEQVRLMLLRAPLEVGIERMEELRDDVIRGEISFEDAAAAVNGSVEVGNHRLLELPSVISTGLRLRIGELNGPFELEDGVVLALVLNVNFQMLGDGKERQRILPIINATRLQELQQEWIENLRNRGTVEILREPS